MSTMLVSPTRKLIRAYLPIFTPTWASVTGFAYTLTWKRDASGNVIIGYDIRLFW